MKQDTLLSVPKLVNVGYTPILTTERVEVYNMCDVNFMVSREAVLRGWRKAESDMSRIPMEKDSQPAMLKMLTHKPSILKKHHYS